jgi:RNA polymerase sigma factor (sigma-70 family)
MNLNNLKQLAVALYEQHEKIQYFNFLESIKNSTKSDKTKVLMETVEKGFGLLYEVELDGEEDSEVDASEEAAPVAAPEKKSVPPGFRDYVNLTNKLMAGTIAKFKQNPAEETRKMMEIIKNGKGKVAGKTLNKFKDFSVITDYNYTPDQPSDESDKEMAKNILLSTALPHWVYQGVQIGRTADYEEAGHDFIVDAINGGYGTPSAVERLAKFISAYDPEKKGSFMNWEKRGLANLKKHAVATSEGTTVTSKVWNPETVYKQGDVVNHARKNWKAVNDEMVAGMEPGKDNNFWEPQEKKLDEISTDAPVGSGTDDDAHTTVGDTIQSDENTPEEDMHDTDVKDLVNTVLSRLPNNERFAKIKNIASMYFKDGLTQEEIAEKSGVSKQRIDQLLKELKDSMLAIISNDKALRAKALETHRD